MGEGVSVGAGHGVTGGDVGGGPADLYGVSPSDEQRDGELEVCYSWESGWCGWCWGCGAEFAGVCAVGAVLVSEVGEAVTIVVDAVCALACGGWWWRGSVRK